MHRKIKGEIKSLIGVKSGRKKRTLEENPVKEKEKRQNSEKCKKPYEKIVTNTETSLENKINFCLTVFATENDFKDPIKYLENLWNEHKESTGIIKIIPPERWKKINENIFIDRILPNLKNSQKTFETRIQTLNKLFKGKVNKFFLKIFFFIIYRNSIMLGI